MSVQCMYTVPSELYTEEDVIFLRIRVTDGGEMPYGYWELNMGTLEEQPALLIAEPSLQPLFFILVTWYGHSVHL